jgi:hypothetical protein
MLALLRKPGHSGTVSRNSLMCTYVRGSKSRSRPPVRNPVWYYCHGQKRYLSFQIINLDFCYISRHLLPLSSSPAAAPTLIYTIEICSSQSSCCPLPRSLRSYFSPLLSLVPARVPALSKPAKPAIFSLREKVHPRTPPVHFET